MAIISFQLQYTLGHVLNERYRLIEVVIVSINVSMRLAHFTLDENHLITDQTPITLSITLVFSLV